MGLLMRNLSVIGVAFFIISLIMHSCNYLSAFAIDLNIYMQAKEYHSKEYQDSTQIPISVLTISTQPDAKSESDFIGHPFSSHLSIDERSDSFKILVSGPAFVPRTISLRRLPLERKIVQRNFELYFVKPTIDTTYDEIDYAARRITECGKDEISKQSALLEYAYGKLEHPKTQYGIKVKYNYARILLEFCKSGFDTCENAANLWKTLQDDYADNEIYFIRESIGPRQAHRANEIINDVLHNETVQEVIIEWPQIEKNFREGSDGYKSAGEYLKLLCDQYNDNHENAKIWGTNGKPRYSICRDAGVSFLLYSDYVATNPNTDDSSIRERFQYIDKSITYFELAMSIGDRSTRTQQNLSLAKEKKDRLRAYELRRLKHKRYEELQEVMEHHEFELDWDEEGCERGAFPDF